MSQYYCDFRSLLRVICTDDFRCLLQRGPPLPISNREVKPVSADGTGIPGEYVDAAF